jgi:serine/threonine protein kinase/tetratricopeptide (TPR) repeat protein
VTEEDLFLRALDVPATDRPAFLAGACGRDESLRRRVEVLVAAHDNPGSFLAGPATAEHSEAAEEVGTRVGPYKLLQQLGEGGMGTVWVAEQEHPVKRRVALKVVKPGMDSARVIARFEAERQALALMDHTNIAKVLDAGTTHHGRPYFVMELVKGVPITKYCDELHLPVRERLELFVPVCAAVQHAHQKGIIHRDLKPNNILVGVQDGRPVPKVIDFGVAKALYTKLADRTMYTEIGAVIGTFEYMAPEQAELSALDIDTRADVYALGVLLYELLTGSTPLTRQRVKSAALADVLRIIKEEEPPSPSSRLTASNETLTTLATKRRTEPKRLRAEVRGELDWIVMRALEKDRTRRYETAVGLAHDIQRYLSDEPVEARPASAAYRFRKFARRNRRQVAAVAVVLVALVGGVIGTSWQVVRATRAEAAARAERDAADAARARADRNFQKARAAVEDYLQNVTENPDLKYRGDFHDLRKQLLAAALPFYEEFVREQSDVPRIRSDQGKAHVQLARVRGEIGEHVTAIRDYNTARDIFDRLVTDFPDVPDYQCELARCQFGLGALQKELGKRTEVEAAWRQASAIQEKLVAEFPAVPDYRSDLAKSRHSLGALLKDLERWAAAEQEIRHALELYATLVTEFPAVPDYRNSLATSHHFLGQVLTNGEAEAEHRKALDLQEKLVTEFRAVPDYRIRLARSHGSLGRILLNRGKRDEAETSIRRALALVEDLAAKFPTVPDYVNSRAGCYRNLGALLKASGQWPEAEDAYRLALTIQQKVADEFRNITVYRALLAHSHVDLSLLLRDLARLTEAESEVRSALEIQTKLVAEFPDIPGYRTISGRMYVILGNLRGDRQESTEALHWYAEAIRVLEGVLARDARVSFARASLRNAYWGQATALRRLARPAEAVESCDRALALDGGATSAEIRLERHMGLAAQTGDHARAISEADELTQGDPVSGGTLYAAAGVYALASAAQLDGPRRESLAAQAVALLRRARTAGFFDGRGHVENMKTNPDNAALRARADFQTLLSELDPARQPRIDRPGCLPTIVFLADRTSTVCR